jgi:thioredoxin 1
MSIVTVTKDTFQSEVLDSDTPVLVDFWATWCNPCKMTEPIVDELSKQYEGKLKIAKIDVDADPEISQQFSVMSIPTFIVFKDGQPQQNLIGVHPKPEFEQMVEANL